MIDESGFGDFEFERRFFAWEIPQIYRDSPTLIVQSYYLADAGYALRVRALATQVDANLDEDSCARTVLHRHAEEMNFASVTVKGPSTGGTRYEAERDIDPRVAVELMSRGGAPIVKTRYAAWIGADGWSIDVFGGDNWPLIIAECERAGPVTELQIPDFCVTELTDDWRFSNESLANTPYLGWRDAYEREIAATGTSFRQDFGSNSRITAP
ncbi:MAG: hypothetical protein LBH13_04530 [Cellulomonadaceae bacterium]|jgi:CYTH domain-containing protein|nr:hypothetical protein [Cellulomonadaceae bacterium]